MRGDTTEDDEGRGSRLRRILVWPLCLVILGMHVFWGDEGYSPESLILAGLIGCVTAISIAYASAFVLPAVPILLSYFYVAMARPVFDPPFLKGANGPVYLSSSSYEWALLGCFIFVLALLLGSRLIRGAGRRAGERVAPLLDPPDAYSRHHTLVARICAAASLVFFVFVNLRASLIPPSISFAVTLFSSPAIPLGLLFWDAHRTNGPLAHALFWIAVTFTALLGLSSGALGQGITPGLIAAALLWTVSGRVPVTLVVLGIAVLLILNPAKYRYRQLTWATTDGDIGVPERIDAWVEAISYTYSAQTDAAIDASVESTAYRTSSLPFVALVMENTPGIIPYAGPARWLELPLMFVPRVLWPEKPDHREAFNVEFTLTFGLQTTGGARSTTLNLPSVADGYWRLGWFGVAIEGLFLGLMLGLFQGARVKDSRALLILGIGFTVATQADKHVSQILASFPQYIFATATILYAVRSLTIWFAPPAAPKLTFQPAARRPSSLETASPLHDEYRR